MTSRRVFSGYIQASVTFLAMLAFILFAVYGQQPPQRRRQPPPANNKKDDPPKSDKQDDPEKDKDKDKDDKDKKDGNTDSNATDSSAENKPESEIDVTKLRMILAGLVDDAKELPLNTRPYAFADIADAYCQIDKTRSAEVYKLAMDSAYQKGGPPNGRAIARNIGLRESDCLHPDRPSQNPAGQRVSGRSSTGGNRRYGNNNRPPDPAEIDPDFVPGDDSSNDGSASFDSDQVESIMEKAAIDRSSSDASYRFYLSRFAAYPLVRIYQLDQLLYLAGYPFGRSESWGFPLGLNSASTLIGFGGAPISNFEPDASLAGYFLDVALEDIQVAFNILQTAPFPERDIRSRIILFALEYLNDDVYRYRPNLTTVWRQLYQQALLFNSPNQQQIVASWVLYIQKFRRDNAIERTISKLDFNKNLDKALDEVSQLPAGCSRDRLYARIALSDVTPEKSDRMTTISERIEEKALRDLVQEAIYYDNAKASISSADSIGLSALIERVQDTQERALLYLMMARRSLKEGDPAAASISLNEVRRLASDNWDSKQKAVVLLSAATVYAKFDPVGVTETFGEAIRTINQTRGENVEALTISRKVESECSTGIKSLVGEVGPEAHINLYDAATVIAASDFDGALLVINNLDDSATKIRATAYVVKSLVKPPDTKAKPKTDTKAATPPNTGTPDRPQLLHSRN
ncbi:MAG TPA: hypothetical protein VFC63_20020 [Blastocatellia bacterium]|nr:hypothetical protein [Blastocatellia bacterium]